MEKNGDNGEDWREWRMGKLLHAYSSLLEDENKTSQSSKDEPSAIQGKSASSSFCED